MYMHVYIYAIAGIIFYTLLNFLLGSMLIDVKTNECKIKY